MGFFDKKATTSNSTSASQTTPSVGGVNNDGSAFGFGNISSSGKYGSNTITVNTTDGGAIAGAFGVADTAFDFASGTVRDAVALTADAQRTALSFVDHAYGDTVALAGRVLDKQTVANLEFLGEVSNFASLSAKTQLENAALSERQAALAIGEVRKAQTEALSMTNKLAQDTQTATLKALDYVFESSKSETARLSETSMKWVVGAAALVFVVPFLFRVK